MSRSSPAINHFTNVTCLHSFLSFFCFGSMAMQGISHPASYTAHAHTPTILSGGIEIHCYSVPALGSSVMDWPSAQGLAGRDIFGISDKKANDTMIFDACVVPTLATAFKGLFLETCSLLLLEELCKEPKSRAMQEEDAPSFSLT